MRNAIWIKQAVWLLIALVAFTGAGLLQEPLDTLREESDLIPPGNEIAQQYPLQSVLTLTLGGLRAPVVAYLWIRSEDFKQSGRHFDAMQTAQMICRMMPRFPGVWDFHSWNMAYNISVQAHTPEERWQWVHNGIRLVRDEGIPLNPKSIILYKQLGWIFWHKMGEESDEMHRVYKQRWAARMQRLLAAPPYADTPEVLAHFAPIADAPLDKRLPPTGYLGQPLQRVVFAQYLLDNPDVEAYVAKLAPLVITGEDRQAGLSRNEIIGGRVLMAYNRFSMDEAVQVVRVAPPRPANFDKPLSDLINAKEYATARGKLLAIIRAHYLWNRYRMDPTWMYRLMKKFGPMDWREVWPHAIYWTTIGLKRCEGIDLDDVAIYKQDIRPITDKIDPLNTYRNWLNCMKDLVSRGRMTYVENPRDPSSPRINWFADYRFIKYTQKVHDQIIRAIIAGNHKAYKDNILKDGHINWLASAISMLYAGYRTKQARELLDWTRETYQLRGKEWIKPLEEFVRIRLNKDGTPIPDYARSQIYASLSSAMYFLATHNREGYMQAVQYAFRVYKAFHKDAPKRIRLKPFEYFIADIAAGMLVEPRAHGYNLSLDDRMALWRALPTAIQLMLYNHVAPPLARQCETENLDFSKCFPPPPGLEDFLQQQQRPFDPLEDM